MNSTNVKRFLALVIIFSVVILLAFLSKSNVKKQSSVELSPSSEKAELSNAEHLYPMAGATLVIYQVDETQITGYPVAGVSYEMAKILDEVDLDKSSVNNDTDINNIETIQPNPIDNEMYFTTSNVYLRIGPGKEYSSESLISKDEIVIVTGEMNGWYLTTDGWICGDYLEKFNEDAYMTNTSLGYTTQMVICECLDEMKIDADPYDVYGLIWTESRGIRTTVGADGDSGYMQIIPSTWKSCYPLLKEDFPELSDKYLVNDPFDENANVLMGCYVIYRVMKELGVDSYKENKSMILTSYNRGVGNANEYYKRHSTYSTEYSILVIRNGDYIRKYNTWEGI